MKLDANLYKKLNYAYLVLLDYDNTQSGKDTLADQLTHCFFLKLLVPT
jgi:hypothetical protein